MENSTTNRNLFVGKCELKSPVKISGLQPTEKVTFYNSNTGSRLMDAPNISFKYAENNIKTIKDIEHTDNKSVIDTIGVLRWTDKTKSVLCGPKNSKHEREIRSGMHWCNKISAWRERISKFQENKPYRFTSLLVDEYCGKRLATTTCTEYRDYEKNINIDWDNHNIQPITTKHCCPVIESVKVNHYLQYANLNCKRKVTPYPGESTVRCGFC